MFRKQQHPWTVTAKRCAFCDGKFGLIRHYSWSTALCSKECLNHFKARQHSDRKWLCLEETSL